MIRPKNTSSKQHLENIDYMPNDKHLSASYNEQYKREKMNLSGSNVDQNKTGDFLMT